MVDFPVLVLRRGPSGPAEFRGEDVGVFPTLQRGDGGFFVLQAVEVFQEEEPGRLLGVIEFAGASGVLPKDVIDVFEDLFEHAEVMGGGTAGDTAFCVASLTIKRLARRTKFPLHPWLFQCHLTKV